MPGPVFLESERLRLRTVEEEDIEFLQRGTNDPAVRRYIDAFSTPQNRTQQRETFEEVDSDGEGTSLLAVPREGHPQAGEAVGSVQLFPVNLTRRYANFGVWFLPTVWGNGYATEASAHLLDHAFLGRGLHRVSASVSAANEASIALCERLGFVHEGTSRDLGFVDGGFADLERYALLEDEWPGSGAVLD